MSYRIGRNAQSLSLTHGTGVTTAQNTSVALNGKLWQVNAITPATVDGSATATINVIDQDGVTVYTKASIAANTAEGDKLTTPVALSGNYTVQVVFSAAQTTHDSITKVNLLIEG